MKPYFTEFKNNTNWCEGMVGEYNFQAKLFDEPSIHGINSGRISKLSIWDQRIREEKKSFFDACIVGYDRGWDIKPLEEVMSYYHAVLNFLENAPKRFDHGKSKS